MSFGRLVFSSISICYLCRDCKQIPDQLLAQWMSPSYTWLHRFFNRVPFFSNILRAY